MGSGFGSISGAYSSVLVQGGSAQAGAKNLHKTVEFGVQTVSQNSRPNQPISVHFQGNFLTLISLIFMLKFEANLSVFMQSYV